MNFLNIHLINRNIPIRIQYKLGFLVSDKTIKEQNHKIMKMWIYCSLKFREDELIRLCVLAGLICVNTVICVLTTVMVFIQLFIGREKLKSKQVKRCENMKITPLKMAENLVRKEQTIERKEILNLRIDPVTGQDCSSRSCDNIPGYLS